ncbi:hypothetical protein RclHR1_23220001 [Rhizophagus clarus]|uniref:ZSWIM1/3 RNaseH-like domain-containing protein n=1 Tax=Rhizophagus clarus TaxID=94130 RepID=A0A2Z6QXJ7_9GLOM|nr:hypothetical protein RclHR1_23220001 [Rhizophagus clarus]GES98639.1 hypothetical protein GLOIN_2v1487159 [Rhizophagus clarus]
MDYLNPQITDCISSYKDSSNYIHSLLDVDRIKHPQAIRTLMKKEAVKNYLLPAITAAVKEYATIKLDLGANMQELKRKEVTNIKYKVRELMEVYLIGNSDLKLDILQSVSYLKEQGYQVETYRILQRSTKGIVFAHPEQLKKLEKYGWLTLIDSTHKTNRYDWYLFTLYVHDTYRCWNIGAHFLVSSEDSNTVAEALKKIYSYCAWSSRYILSDQSDVEFKSIKIVFSGVNAGEQECKVLLCIVHVMRTWMSKIYEKKPRML